jgi:hypothetical protein
MIFTLFLAIQQMYMQNKNTIEQHTIDMEDEKIYIINMFYLTQEELDELV